MSNIMISIVLSLGVIGTGYGLWALIKELVWTSRPVVFYGSRDRTDRSHGWFSIHRALVTIGGILIGLGISQLPAPEAHRYLGAAAIVLGFIGMLIWAGSLEESYLGASIGGMLILMCGVYGFFGHALPSAQAETERLEAEKAKRLQNPPLYDTLVKYDAQGDPEIILITKKP